MKRQFALAAGAVLVSSLALGLGDVRATGSDDKDKTVVGRIDDNLVLAPERYIREHEHS